MHFSGVNQAYKCAKDILVRACGSTIFNTILERAAVLAQIDLPGCQLTVERATEVQTNTSSIRPLDFDPFTGSLTTENPLHSVNESVEGDGRTFGITNKIGFPENKTNFPNATNSAFIVSSTTKPTCSDLEKLYNCVAIVQTYLKGSRDNSNLPFPTSLENLHEMCDANVEFQHCLDDVGVSPTLRITCSEEPVLKEVSATVGKMCTQRQGMHIRLKLEIS